MAVIDAQALEAGQVRFRVRLVLRDVRGADEDAQALAQSRGNQGRLNLCDDA